MPAVLFRSKRKKKRLKIGLIWLWEPGQWRSHIQNITKFWLMSEYSCASKFFHWFHVDKSITALLKKPKCLSYSTGQRPPLCEFSRSLSHGGEGGCSSNLSLDRVLHGSRRQPFPLINHPPPTPETSCPLVRTK